MAEISKNERSVLLFLSSQNGWVREDSIRVIGLDSRAVASAVSYLERKGLISVRRETEEYQIATDEARRYADTGLPEQRAVELVKKGKNKVADLMDELGQDEGKIALAQLSKLGIRPAKGILVIEKPDSVERELEVRREALRALVMGKQVDGEVLKHLRGRGNLLRSEKRLVRMVMINSAGREAVSVPYESNKIDQITPELLEKGMWKGRSFRRFDITAPVSPIYGSYYHPLTTLIRKIREIFFDLGFTEMTGNYVESSFWNMDVLFIPQDHSARDMQDTFFIDAKASGDDIPEDLEKRVKRIHERGFDGYRGWEYPWSGEEGRKLLLRTHTTASTARYLYQHNNPPVSVFSVERVFRHESVDWKHLAEFHQIEGAVYSKEVSLSTLKWILREFYGRLGFKDIRLIPSYYPYTEPSMDVVVSFNGKEIELGGSGIFRPEVGKILGLKAPAMAWGLGLERLAFLYYDLEDIRSIYNSDIEWLRRFTLKI